MHLAFKVKTKLFYVQPAKNVSHQLATYRKKLYAWASAKGARRATPPEFSYMIQIKQREA